MSDYIPTIDFNSLEPDTMRHVEVNGAPVVLVRQGDEVFALHDRCTHEEFPLSDGWLDEHRLVCSYHGAQYDIKTGEALALPAYENVKTWPVRVVNGIIEINMKAD